MNEEIGTLTVRAQSADKKTGSFMSRSCVSPSADSLLIYKALEFRDAAARDGRVFVCALVPRWKGCILRLLGVK